MSPIVYRIELTHEKLFFNPSQLAAGGVLKELSTRSDETTPIQLKHFKALR